MMKNKFNAGWRWVFILIVGAGIGLAAKGYSVHSANTPVPPVAQDLMNLNQRVNSLEQRLVMIESSVRRVEQQQMAGSRATMPAAPARDPEVERLRSQVETLTLRIRELECGIVKLDERTLSATMKEARRRVGGETKDPCRLDANAPVTLSMRQ
jgi:hypothetical protein